MAARKGMKNGKGTPGGGAGFCKRWGELGKGRSGTRCCCRRWVYMWLDLSWGDGGCRLRTKREREREKMCEYKSGSAYLSDLGRHWGSFPGARSANKMERRWRWGSRGSRCWFLTNVYKLCCRNNGLLWLDAAIGEWCRELPCRDFFLACFSSA